MPLCHESDPTSTTVLTDTWTFSKLIVSLKIFRVHGPGGLTVDDPLQKDRKVSKEKDGHLSVAIEFTTTTRVTKQQLSFKDTQKDEWGRMAEPSNVLD